MTSQGMGVKKARSWKARTAVRLRLGARLGVLALTATLFSQVHTTGAEACAFTAPAPAESEAGPVCPRQVSVGVTARLASGKPSTRAAVPASLHVGFTSKAVDGTTPALSEIEFGVSRVVELHTDGLPSCSFAELYSAVESPGHSCAKSLVGHGIVDSEIALSGEEPVNVEGHLSAFYVLRKEGRFILARVRTGAPMPLIYVIPFKIVKQREGAFGTYLVVHGMRAITGICIRPNCFSPYTLRGVYSRISRLELSLHRPYRHGAERDSFLNARCPKKSFPLAFFALHYDDFQKLTMVKGNCQT
jgi:hypothetical protein